MSERYEIRTIPRSDWQGLADHYVTTIYDRLSGIMVACAGNTPTDSEENATVHLAILNCLKNPYQEF